MKLEKLLPILVSILLVIVLFFGVLSGTSGIFKDQAYEFHYQSASYLNEQLRLGDFPLWNRHAGMGEPYAGYPEFSVFYPLFIPFTLLLDPFWAVNLLILLQYILIAGFTAALARQLGISNTGATIAAIGFAFCGYLLFLHTELQNLATMAALPAALYFFERYKYTNSIRFIACTGLALGIGHLAGGMQYAYYCDLGFIFWALLIHPPDTESKAAYFKSTITALAALALSLAIAAVLLLPVAQLAQNSLRSDIGYEQAAHSPKGDKDPGFEIGPTDLPGFVYPKEPQTPMSESKPVHFGMPIVLLALLGLIAHRDRRKYWLAGLFALTILLAAGRHTPVFKLFYALPIPGMELFKNPIRVTVLAAFALSLLAGFGADVFLNFRQEKRLKFLVPIVIGVMALLVFALRPGSFYFGAILLFGAMAIMAAALFLPETRNRLSGLLLILSTAIAMLSAYGILDLLPENEVELRSAPNLITETIKKGTPARVFALDPAPTFGFYNQNDLVENTGMARGIDLVDGNSSLHSARYLLFTGAGNPVDPIRQYALDNFLFFEPLRIMANVGYVILRSDAPVPFSGAEKLSEYSGNTLYKLPGAKAAWFSEQWVCTKNMNESTKALVNIREQLPIVDIIESKDCRPGQNPPATIIVKRSLADRIEIELDNSKAGYLVISEGYDPGWQAAVDGKPVQIHPADLALMAIPIDAGAKHISFSYRSKQIKWGARITLLAFFIVFVMIVAPSLISGKNRRSDNP